MARLLLVAAALAAVVQCLPLKEDASRQKRQGFPGIDMGSYIPGGAGQMTPPPGFQPPNCGFTPPAGIPGYPGGTATEKPAEGGAQESGAAGARRKRQFEFGNYIPTGMPGIPGGASTEKPSGEGGSQGSGGGIPGIPGGFQPPNCGFTPPAGIPGYPGGAATEKPAEGEAQESGAAGARRKRQGIPGIDMGSYIPGGGVPTPPSGFQPPNCGFTPPAGIPGYPGGAATEKPAEGGAQESGSAGARRKRQGIPGIDMGSYIPGGGVPTPPSGFQPPNCGFTPPAGIPGYPGGAATEKPAEGAAQESSGSRKKRETDFAGSRKRRHHVQEGSAPGGISSAIQGVEYPDDSVVIEAVESVAEPAPGSMPAGIASGGM